MQIFSFARFGVFFTFLFVTGLAGTQKVCYVKYVCNHDLANVAKTKFVTKNPVHSISFDFGTFNVLVMVNFGWQIACNT